VIRIPCLCEKGSKVLTEVVMQGKFILQLQKQASFITNSSSLFHFSS
jgi:hypothetical protein